MKKIVMLMIEKNKKKVMGITLKQKLMKKR